MGIIGFKEVGILFNHKGPECEFFTNEILNKGLTDFHINVEPNLSVEKKREIVRNTIKNWDIKGKEIYYL